MENREILNRSIYIIIFSLTTIILEMITFGVLKLGGGILPTYVLFDIAYILFISAILFLIKNRKTKITIIIVLLSLQLILNIVNVCYYKILGDIFSFDLLKLGHETLKAFDLNFIYWPGVLLNVFTFTLALLCLFYFTKKEKQEKIKIKKYIRFSSLAIVMSVFMFFSTISLSTKIIAESTLAECSVTDSLYIAKDDTYLYDNFLFKQEAFKKFGTFGFYIKSIANLLDSNKVTNKEKQELINYINSDLVEENNNAILNGDNLIVFMLESFEWFAIDPISTPTLFRLMNSDAQTFTNFYARNKTNISECISILGNSVKSSDFIELSKNKDFMPSNSLAYKFRDNGYTANYFHPYDGNFYNRYKVNTKFGFEKVYALQEIGYEIGALGDSHLEQDFMDRMIEKIAPKNQKFFSFYTTVGTHGPHDKFNPRYQEYFEIYEDNLPQIQAYLNSQGFSIPTDKLYYTRLKEYKCAAMDTDRMIKSLLDYLEENNMLSNTNIVFYSDHNCYYNELNYYTRYGTEDIDPNSSESHNIPFMIYSEKLGANKNEQFCNTYDIYPTICELYGLSYSKNLTQGYNVFSEEIEDSFFASNLTAMFTDRLYSYNIIDVIDFDNLNISEEEINKFQLNAIKFYEKQDKIDKIYINMINKYQS